MDTPQFKSINSRGAAVQEWTSACLSSCSLGDRNLFSCMSNLRSFPDDARGCQCPFVYFFNYLMLSRFSRVRLCATP